LLTLLLVAWGLGIVAQLYRLQFVRHEEFAEKAARQQEWTVELQAPRGTIYDARGRELAVSLRVESAYADAREVRDPIAVARSIQHALDLDLGDRRRLEKELASGRQVVIRRKLEPQAAEALRALELEGIYFHEESKRYYPQGSLASHALGFVGLDDRGLEGLEHLYDDVIAGENVRRTVLKHPGRGYVLDGEAMASLARPGADLYLTLDATLQYLAERELERAVESSGSRAGSIVMLDVRDSAVLAMASWPTFDPNRIQESTPEQRRNRVISDSYEPGSTFKAITAASVLENLVLYPEDRIDCEMGGLQVERAYIRDHKPFPVLTFREVLEKSSNVGVMKAALRLGGEPFLETVERFRLGQRTGIDVPGEGAGNMRDPRWWQRRTSIAYASFGQGITITPLQLANSFAALANGGRLHRPYVVAAVGHDGQREPVAQGGQLLGRVVSTATAQTLMRLLEGVVESGTGKAAALPGYRVAGKTGTAQVAEDGRYSPTARIASFVGVVPSRAPRYVVAIVLDRPRGRTEGGAVAAPVFASMMSDALAYLGDPPDADPWQTEVAWLRLDDTPTEVARLIEGRAAGVGAPGASR
jgi:cell division protein FtsI (penicillin-binding protein 3)